MRRFFANFPICCAVFWCAFNGSGLLVGATEGEDSFWRKGSRWLSEKAESAANLVRDNKDTVLAGTGVLLGAGALGLAAYNTVKIKQDENNKSKEHEYLQHHHHHQNTANGNDLTMRLLPQNAQYQAQEDYRFHHNYVPLQNLNAHQDLQYYSQYYEAHNGNNAQSDALYANVKAQSGEDASLAIATGCPFGQLSMRGRYMFGQGGQPVILRGMSLYWSDGQPQFYNDQTVKCLRCSWSANIVRAAMTVEHDQGYLNNPTAQMGLVKAVVSAAIAHNMYVLIDWHVEGSDSYKANAANFTNRAKLFFSQMAQFCANRCNCLYELWNEPRMLDWNSQLKPYYLTVLREIRKYSQGVAVCGVWDGSWNQDWHVALNNPIREFPNVAYTIHFYANPQKDRNTAQAAVNRGLPLFCSEYGTTWVQAKAPVQYDETRAWWKFMDDNKISSMNWAVDQFPENTAVLVQNAGAADLCNPAKFTLSGKFVHDWMVGANPRPQC